MNKLRKEKEEAEKKKLAEAHAQKIKEGIEADLAEDIHEAANRVIELIESAKITSASPMAGGTTIQCRIRAGGRIYRTSACESWIRRHQTLNTLSGIDSINLMQDLFKLDRDHPLLAELYEEADKFAQQRVPKNKLPHTPYQYSPYRLHFNFSPHLCKIITRRIGPKCVALRNAIYAKYAEVLDSGVQVKKQKEHELRKALKIFKPALEEVLKAGITDEDLQTLVDEARVKMVMKS